MSAIALNRLMDSAGLVREERSSFLDRAKLWIHEHPATIRAMEYAGMFFGTALAVSGTTGAILLLGSSALLVAPIPLIGGGILATASLAAWLGLDLLVPPAHNMKEHIFTPATCDGGSLFYQGDVPILSLDADRPYAAGKAHGYLLGKQLSPLVFKMHLAMTYLLRQPMNEKMSGVLQQLRQRIPAEYLQEMQGLADGINSWTDEHCWLPKKRVTLDDLLLIHLMPDMIHFSPSGNPLPQVNLACTAVVDRDPREGMTFARNMDWKSWGCLGSLSVMIHRKHRNGARSTLEVGIAGFVGTLTGMNDRGLTVAMNVCDGKTNTVRGIPSAFYNRMCLERNSSLAEARAMMQNVAPLGPYHLTVADENGAESWNFYQEEPTTHRPVIRRLDDRQPLTVLNCRYASSGARQDHMHYGHERSDNLRKFYQVAQINSTSPQMERGKLAEGCLALPFVNNEETTHSVVMYPRTRRMKVAFNNAYAGKDSMHTVDTSSLF